MWREEEEAHCSGHAGSSSQVGSTTPSCRRRRSAFWWMRCGASNKTGLMDPSPRAEGLEQAVAFPDQPNDSANVAWSCQGKHLLGSGY